MTGIAAQGNKGALALHLAVIFGAGNVIKAVVDKDDYITFTDEGEGKTNNTAREHVPDFAKYFGTGEYKVSIFEDHFNIEPFSKAGETNENKEETMSNQETSTPLLTDKIIAVFGVGAKITADVNDEGEVMFRDAEGQNVLITTLPEEVALFGVGRYDITVHANSFEFKLVEEIKPAQYLIKVQEAIGHAENNATLAAIYKQQLEANGTTDDVVKERVEALLKKHPIGTFSHEEAHNYVMERLAGDVMNWEDFTVGMAVIGAESITIAVR